MGCFSFLCKVSNKPALSTSFDGSPTHLFLLKDGEVLEHMYGKYNSYGRVFDESGVNSLEWDMRWGDVCDLIFNPNEGDGIALVLQEYFRGELPTTQSVGDPNQGWGEDYEHMNKPEDSWVLKDFPFHINPSNI